MGHMKNLDIVLRNGGQEAVDAVSRMASDIEDMMPRWIPVGERLPKEYETVLVATDGGVSAGEIRFPDSECDMDEPWWMVFKNRRDQSVSWAGFVSFANVTHWMPLPEPPARESE